MEPSTEKAVPTLLNNKLDTVSQFTLSEEEIERLYAEQNECTVCWTTKDGWPMGMTHNYLWAKGSIWVNSNDSRKRVRALRDRPQSCIVISSNGSSCDYGGMVSMKTLATIHHDREMLEWFLPLWLDRVHAPQDWIDLYLTPHRVVIEFKPVKIMSFHGNRSVAAIVASRLAFPGTAEC